MKIAFFTDSYKPYISGVVRSVESFMIELQNAGNEVYIFAPDYPGSKKEDNIFRFKSLPAGAVPGFRLALPLSTSVFNRVKELDLDLIHTHSPFLMGWLGKLISRRLNIPLVFTYHTLYEKYAHYFPLGEGVARKLAINYSKRYCQNCDLVIAPTDYVENMLLGYGIKTAIKTVPTGIDIHKYYNKNGLWIRSEYGIRDDEKILLFVGRLGQEKNIELLMETFKMVSESLANTRLIMVGDGPLRKKLLKMTDDYMLNDKIIFTGEKEPDEVVDFYLASDLFVFPSLTETQGLVTLEAMAGGLPVIAVNAAGTTSMVDDGLNGLLVKADPHYFSRAVINLLTHDKRYNLFVKNAVKKAEEYNMKTLTKILLKSYREIGYGDNNHYPIN